jgi:hypothetical protein
LLVAVAVADFEGEKKKKIGGRKRQSLSTGLGW